MADKIMVRRGLKAEMPQLAPGEIGFCTDTDEAFIGNGKGNVNMNGSLWHMGEEISGTSSAAGAYSYSACPTVKEGDCYLNTSYGCVYQCTTAGSGTSAKWTYKGCIKGAKGDTGSDAAVTVDASLSSASANPVQNKAVNEKIEELAGRLQKLENNSTNILWLSLYNNKDAYQEIDNYDAWDATYDDYETDGSNGDSSILIDTYVTVPKESDYPVFFIAFFHANDDEVVWVQSVLYNNGSIMERNKTLYYFTDGVISNPRWSPWQEDGAYSVEARSQFERLMIV